MNIKTENLHKNFHLDHGVQIKALRGIDLEINEGQRTAIVGPSGAGKSTLIHILGLMDQASDGRLFMDDRDLTNTSDAVRSDIRRDKIGFLFQMHYLLPEFSMWENIIIPAWQNKYEASKRAKQLIDQLGLKERTSHLPSELSGGEQQRCALARALINEPEVLFADEPTGNLDRETGQKVEALIFDECKKRNITLILVTHNEELAKKAGRIIYMRDGVLVDN